MPEKRISVIPAKKQYGKKAKENNKALRVAAYCRVSTLMEHQESSYETQVAYYTNLIGSNPNWKMAGIYADDGITATNTRKRDDFNAMIDACKKGKIDLVLTKSISRFARNTVDALQYIRELKSRNIAIMFEKEGINTLDGSGELLITILSSQAQEESRNISENIKWSLRRKYENGGVHTSRLLGYKLGESKKLEIIPEEAEIVRYIFKEYLDGRTACAIAKQLEEKGIKTRRGNTRWNPAVVDKVLMNEKYMGDVLSQKTYTADFLTKKRESNNGELPQYYVENSHDAIVSKEDFYRAKEERIRRAALKNRSAGKQDKDCKSKYSSKYALSEIMVCAECGQPYRRQVWTRNEVKKAVWRCGNRLKNGTEFCKHSPTISEEILHEAIVNAINTVITNKEYFIETFRENVISVLRNHEESTESRDYDGEIEKLKSELVTLVEGISEENTEDTEFDEKYKNICEKIDTLKQEKSKAQMKEISNQSAETRINSINRYLNGITQLTEYDDVLIRKLIETIEIINEAKMEVRFKSGIVIEQRFDGLQM